ncbi:hypothetical protein Tco_0606868, partial [Tanacetum coccineum]
SHTTIIQPSKYQPQKKQRPRKSKRKDNEIPQSSGPTDNVADEAVNEEMDDSLERAATAATSLDAEQDRGGGPRRQETMGDTIDQTMFKNVSKTSNDPLLVRGNTLRSGEDSLKLNELMELCTNLQQRVLDLETTKTTQANEIAILKRRVKKLERRNKSRTYGLKRMYRGRIADIDANKDIYLVNVHTDEYMFDVNDLDGDEVIVDNASIIPVSAATTITTTTATINDVEITLAQALAKLKSAKPKAVKVVIQEPEQGTTTTTPKTIIYVPKPPHDKGKGIMIEEPVVEQVKPVKRLEQMRLDEELAFKLQAEEGEEEEEERLAREKAHQTEEANIAWDDVQAKIKADYQLAQRLQAQERKKNRPPTKAQQRSIMCTYLKDMKGWKPKNLKNKSFANIQELFDKAMKRVNTFVDYRTELVEETEIAQERSSKRAREELEQESSKKQKVEEDKESKELKVTAAKLMLLVYKLLLLVLKVNAASTKVTTAQRLRLLKEFLLSEKG